MKVSYVYILIYINSIWKGTEYYICSFSLIIIENIFDLPYATVLSGALWKADQSNPSDSQYNTDLVVSLG